MELCNLLKTTTKWHTEMHKFLNINLNKKYNQKEKELKYNQK